MRTTNHMKKSDIYSQPAKIGGGAVREISSTKKDNEKQIIKY
jgi:hypothetical protein